MLKTVNEKILLFDYFNRNRRNDVTRVAGILGECHTWNLSSECVIQGHDYMHISELKGHNVFVHLILFFMLINH